MSHKVNQRARERVVVEKSREGCLSSINFTHCDELYLVVCFVSFRLFIIVFMCFIYVRVDTVMSRNGMNKVVCILY